jgi:hypothetical protein
MLHSVWDLSDYWFSRDAAGAPGSDEWLGIDIAATGVWGNGSQARRAGRRTAARDRADT